MGGASGTGGGPGSAMGQLNGKTLADAPPITDGNLYYRIFGEGRDPAEAAASRAAWKNGAMGMSGQQAAPQAQPMTISQTLAQMMQGMPQASQQSVPQPQAAQPQSNMPIFSQPAISPQQQYMQRMGINRMPFNPQAYRNPYAAPRAPQNFQPQLRPNISQSSTAPKPAPQQSEMDKMREELDALRAWREQSTGYQGNSN